MSRTPTPEQFHAWVDQRLVMPLLMAVHGHMDVWAVNRASTYGLSAQLKAFSWPDRGLPTNLTTWLYRRPSSLEISGTFDVGPRRIPVAGRAVGQERRLVIAELETPHLRFRAEARQDAPTKQRHLQRTARR